MPRFPRKNPGQTTASHAVARERSHSIKPQWMTPDQKSSFCATGCLLVKRALTKNQTESIKQGVFDELKRLRIWASGKTLSASMKVMPAFQQIAKLSTLIRQDNLHAKLVSHDTFSIVASLSETRLIPAQSQLLVSLPNQGEWTLNGLNWHTDISPSGHRRVPGVQAFILIDDVLPRGGATLAMAGSHLLADREDLSRHLREVLRQKGDLVGELSKNNLSILEMSGQAGDVYLMDMRVLHTPSVNATKKLRIMATIRYLPL